MTTPTIVERLSRRLFDQKLIRNSIRGELVEEMVAMALEPHWALSADDWSAFDLQHRASGKRMQVKQSAACQSWHCESSPPAKPRFSIANKTGRYEGLNWVEEPGRNADLFVFGWHPLLPPEADHREADQWRFFVVPEHDLPSSASIGLAGLMRLAQPVSIRALPDAVEAALDRL